MPDYVHKVLTYSRVSTDRDQSPNAQRDALSNYCKLRNWKIIEEIVDHGYSGGTDKRPGLKRLMTLVRSRQVDCVVVSKLDRIARSLKHLIGILEELQDLGVHFISIHDQVDMTTATGRLMVHIISSFAEFERALIRERTVLGLAHARSKGKRLGRPLKRDDKAIRALRDRGMSYSAIQTRLGISKGAVCRALRSTPKRLQNRRKILNQIKVRYEKKSHPEIERLRDSLESSSN